ncbi:hypothetical protein [Vibrio fluvialis]|uniref:hypothetical protein n=1 Tax=Vibrio fluvialis TaxID=676 RepID=UPI003D7E0A90
MKRLVLFAVFGLAGCASKPSVEWVTSTSMDKFTDQAECLVTVGSYYADTGVYTLTGHLYPFIKEVNGQLWVGIKSGGKYPVPVGAVQLRVDKNDAWTIEKDETPTDGLPDTLNFKSYIDLDAYPEEQRKMIQASYKQSSEMTKRMMAPYTVTTGVKAKAILSEMLQGKTLIYRSINPLQPSDNVGEYQLDSSLKKSLEMCNIRY